MKFKIIGVIIISLLPGMVFAKTLQNFEKNTENTASKDYLTQSIKIQFDGFSDESHLDFEEYLVIFGGYKSHATIFSKRKYWELNYVTNTKIDRMKRNLYKMLKILDINASIRFSGNTFIIIKNYREKKNS